MVSNKTLAVVIIAVLLILTVAFVLINQSMTKTTTTTTTTTLPTGEEMIAGNGDTVEVNYIGSFLNGTVFDTSYKDVAIQNGIYDPSRKYPSLKFKIGAGQVIRGFENSVMGMRVGEEKTVTIPSTLAYGKYDPRLVMDINRTQKSSRIQNVTFERFLTVIGKEPFVGMNFTVSSTPWPIRVVVMTNVTKEVNMSLKEFNNYTKANPANGKSFSIPGIRWPVTVLNFDNSTVNVNLTDTIISIRHNPSGGEVVDTILGSAVVSVTDTEVMVRVNPVLGMTYDDKRVIAINETTVTVDMNHELAGKNLVFKIKLENVTRAPPVPVLNLTRQ